MTYKATRHYKCDYCGKKQTNPETVYVLLSHGIDGYACEDCIKKGKASGYTINVDRKEEEK